MRAYRELRPAPTREHDPSNAAGPPRQLAIAKRPGKTKIACEACHGRKTKCDGRRPACRACEVSNRNCEYAREYDISCTEALRQKNDELEIRNELLTKLFGLLSSLQEPELRAILPWIKSAHLPPDVEQLVCFIQHGQTLVQLSQAGADAGAVIQDPVAPAISPSDNLRDSSLLARPPGALQTLYEPKLFGWLLRMDDLMRR